MFFNWVYAYLVRTVLNAMPSSEEAAPLSSPQPEQEYIE